MLALLASTPAWSLNAPVLSPRTPVPVRSSAAVMSSEAAAKAAWLAKTQPAWGPPAGAVGSVASTSVAAAPAPAIDESAAKAAWLAKSKPPSWGPGGGQSAAESAEFVHAPVSYFALDKLASKGTRRAGGSLVDVGEPEDWSRPIAKTAWNGARAGSWACSEGGWDSPKLRPTTETFLVLEGSGSVCDKDGTPHPFYPGDVVVLPKHWCGRWDVTQLIHKARALP
jgi:uncharacterized cupin superfamily protein